MTGKRNPAPQWSGVSFDSRPDLADRSNSLTKGKISSILNAKYQTACTEYVSCGQEQFPMAGVPFSG
jgi:hypothetical protein